MGDSANLAEVLKKFLSIVKTQLVLEKDWW